MARAAAAAWYSTDVNLTPTDFTTDTDAVNGASAATLNLDVDAPSNGAVLAFAYAGATSGTGSVAWTGLAAEDHDGANENAVFSAAHENGVGAATPRTVTAAFSGGAFFSASGIAAAFQPAAGNTARAFGAVMG
jgi:hypothetical protein